MYPQRPSLPPLYFPPPPPHFHHSPPPPSHFHHSPIPRGNFHVPTQIIRQQQYQYHLQRLQQQQQQQRRTSRHGNDLRYRQPSTASSFQKKYVSGVGDGLKSPQSISDPRQPPFSLMRGFKKATTWIGKTFCFCATDDNSHIIDINHMQKKERVDSTIKKN